MSYHPKMKGVQTSSARGLSLDTLEIPCFGAADPPLSSVKGTLAKRVASVTYGSQQWTITFRRSGDTGEAGSVVLPFVELGSAPLFHVSLEQVTSTTFLLHFYTATGTTNPPPIAATNALVRLVLLNYGQ